MVDVQQRKPRHRPDGRPRPGDIEQRQRHAHLGAGLLHVPGQLTQTGAVHLRARQHGHGIGVEPLHHRGHAVQPTADRYVGHLTLALGTGHARRHYRQAIVVVPPQQGHQILHPGRVANRHRTPHELTPAPAPMQPLPQPVPGSEVQGGSKWQRYHEITAREIELRRIGDDRYPRGQAYRRVEDLAELLRANSNEPPVVAARYRQRAQPQQREHHGETEIPGRDGIPAVKADRQRRQPRHQRTQAIHDNSQTQIATRPTGTDGHRWPQR